MSLSARIAIRSSRRLEVVAGCMAIGGVIVASVTAAGRWPDIAAALVGAVAIAAIVAITFLIRSDRAASGYVLSVAGRVEVAVSPEAESGDGGSWRLDDSTMMWPGFSVIGLRGESDAGQKGRSMRLAVFDAELRPIDRRALHRFILWSLRGGPGSGTSSRAIPANTPS